MLNQEQFDGLLDFTQTLLTEDAKSVEIIEKAGFTPDQLKVIGLLVAYGIRAYDALQEGGELMKR